MCSPALVVAVLCVLAFASSYTRFNGARVGVKFRCCSGLEDNGEPSESGGAQEYERMEETFRDITEYEAKKKEDSSALGALGMKGMDDSNLRDVIDESIMDHGISVAINQLIKDVSIRENGTPAEPKQTPTERFQQMYIDLKAEDEDKNRVEPQDRAAAMLDKLFGGEQTTDPFDERTVMMKLKQIMNPEDFIGLFKDPTIGDYL